MEKLSAFASDGTGDYYWNMQGGAGGASFAAYNNVTGTNAKFYFWYRDSIGTDPGWDINDNSFLPVPRYQMLQRYLSRSRERDEKMYFHPYSDFGAFPAPLRCSWTCRRTI